MGTKQLQLERGTSFQMGSLANIRQPNMEAALKQIFPGKQDETRLQSTRRIMGEAVARVPDEELEVYLTEVRYLLDVWMNEFERELFNNKTLQQVLMEG